MEIILAQEKDAALVRGLVERTIRAVYPAYYCEEAINFFLYWHSEERILPDIRAGAVWLFYEDGQPAATGTQKGGHINRLFVLPAYQGKGIGTAALDFLEGLAAKEADRAVVDSTLGAFGLYIKRGYRAVKSGLENLENGKIMFYEVLEKELIRPADAGFPYAGRVFTGKSGEVFRFHQDGAAVWAEYESGEMEKGRLLGTAEPDGTLAFAYQHFAGSGALAGGNGKGRLEGSTGKTPAFRAEYGTAGEVWELEASR